MINFIHTADIHFGMENYGKIDPKTGIHTRLLDFEKALNFCVDYAIDNEIDFLLFAGDAYKTANPSPTQQKLLMRCLFRLYKKNIPIIIVVGNHDNPLTFGKASALDVFSNIPVDGFHVISKPQIINLETKNGPVQIVGMPWPTRNTIAISDKYIFKSAADITDHIALKVSQLIQHFAGQLDPKIPSVLSGHLTVSSGIFSGSEKRAIFGTDPVLLPSQLAIPPFDYVGLGHLHRYQDLNPDGYPSIIYSGSIERVDFGERKEDKGFCHVTISEKNKTSHKFIKTPTRNFIQIDVYLKPKDEVPTSAVYNHQTAQIMSALKNHDIKDAVVKIKYHIPDSETDIVSLKTVQNACSEAIDIAGIVPVQKLKTRAVRTTMKSDMDLESLLKHYFNSKDELKGKKSKLVKAGLELQQVLDDKETENT